MDVVNAVASNELEYSLDGSLLREVPVPRPVHHIHSRKAVQASCMELEGEGCLATEDLPHRDVLALGPHDDLAGDDCRRTWKACRMANREARGAGRVWEDCRTDRGCWWRSCSVLSCRRAHGLQQTDRLWTNKPTASCWGRLFSPKWTGWSMTWPGGNRL